MPTKDRARPGAPPCIVQNKSVKEGVYRERGGRFPAEASGRGRSRAASQSLALVSAPVHRRYPTAQHSTETTQYAMYSTETKCQGVGG